MIHSVFSSRSDLSAKLSLPLMVRPPSAGGLTSRITFLPVAISTFSPATGTFLFGQVARSDHFVALASAAWTTAHKLPSRTAGTSGKRRNERIFLLMTSTPRNLSSILSESPAEHQKGST